MSRYRNLKGNMKICPYCNGEIEWNGFDFDYEHPLQDESDSGEYKCKNCHFVWHENGRAYKQNE